MNVYDTANRLASEIKQSEEYLEYKKVKEEINQTPELKAKLEEFEKIRYDVQISSIQGQEQDKEKVENIQRLYLELIQNEKVKNYFDLELKFNILLTDVNKIIGEAVKDLLN